MRHDLAQRICWFPVTCGADWGQLHAAGFHPGSDQKMMGKENGILQVGIALLSVG
ncbi:hypothetical protein [Yoonia sp. SS1-5]|uniref:Uncharacterized protein n=1 Tax=Yoonia rhodophyticola TaxID=3137370 RepID=A0AAN0M776_9RHOB